MPEVVCNRASCYDDRAVGGGVDVLILENGEPLLSRRFVDDQEARFVAEAARQDQVRTG